MRMCIAIALALCALLLPVRLAYACDCPMRIAAIDALADSNAVFVGTVRQIRGPQPSLRLTRSFPFILYDTPSYAPLTITLAVSQIWRGPSYRTMTVATGSYFQCGVPFQEGQEYLVYAYRNAVGDLIAHSCSRTVPIRLARDDLALFGAGNAPTQDAPAELPSSMTVLALVCSLALVIAGMIAGVLVMRHRLRRSRRSVVS